MKIIACIGGALMLSVTPVFAQTSAVRFPVAGTLIKKAPVFVPRDDRQPVVVILAEGTAVQVQGRQGVWYRVLFSSPQGEQTGLMAPQDIRIDPNAETLPARDESAAVFQRGFIELRGVGFPQIAANDPHRILGDSLIRQEAFLKPARSLQFAVGVDLRGSSSDEVENEWRLDLDDRSVLRPRAAVRRLSMAITTPHFSLDLGKQIIRWGRADMLSPVDRFAPRDYMNILESEFLPVMGVRTAIRGGGETLELVWVPRMTPSRLPVLGRRWAVMPPEVAGLVLDDRGAVLPEEPEKGVRWVHAGRVELGLSFFDGFNHLPNTDATLDPEHGALAITRTYARLRSYGGEVLIPTPAFTLRGEAAWFTSPTSTSEEYVLYVVEAERQAGEWLFHMGYAGEVVTTVREGTPFAAERGVAHSIIGRAAFTIDPRRSLEIEGAARHNGRGVYAKGEFSQTLGRHWRLTLAAAGIAGDDNDFLGQFQRNSHASATLRFSY